MDELANEAIKEISQENERIESLTQARRNCYSAASARWGTAPTDRVPDDAEGRAAARLGRPVVGSATFLAIGARALRLARDHARELMAYFRSTLEDLVERVNEQHETVEDLMLNWKKLEESSHRMEFDQRRLAAARRRGSRGAARSPAPAQIPRRARVKAEEYEDEIHDSKKQHVGEDGRRLLGWIAARLAARHRG